MQMCDDHKNTLPEVGKAKRVPLQLNETEFAMLAEMATTEQRSKAGMARIIYCAGLKAIEEKNRAARSQ